MLLGKRQIYADDFELLHEGMRRLVNAYKWEVIERPTEVALDAPPNPSVVTLEELGLGRLRPVPEPPEVMACETCVNRTNAPGDGPCVNCDLTFDGPESNYVAETDAPVVLNADDGEVDQELDAFAAQSAAGLPMSGTDEGAPSATEAIEDDEDDEDEDDEDEGEGEGEDEAADTDTET